MIEIEIITKDPLYNLKDMNCITMNKRAKKSNKMLEQPKDKNEVYEYYMDKFIARHSTAEIIQIKVVDDDCRGDIASHIVRHTKSHPRFAVGSCRPDWNNGKKRKPLDEEYKEFGSVWNVIAFQEMAAQRLCYRAASYTRKWAIDLLKTMDESGDPLLMAISMTCVPNCIRYAGCIEGTKTCGKPLPETMITNIRKRMEDYHRELMGE